MEAKMTIKEKHKELRAQLESQNTEDEVKSTS